ncbi:hypothetical protein [Roseovarius sp. MMSF_3281]|uniref:hypothetical protein n=1 Tax=Roseovarius sp. MMSF_3281 TaxID=3046694 RepID=UPI00273D6F7F|nr:hypothetical protein [Roseovarius sp. MMSF_3281]
MTVQGEVVRASAEIPLFSDMGADELAAAMDDPSAPARCRGLWAGVILQQWTLVFDPLSRDSDAVRWQARGWFGGPDFAMACALAGFDPDHVMEAFRVRLALAEVAGDGLPLRPGGRRRGGNDRARAARRREALTGMRAKGLLPPVAVLARSFDVSVAVIRSDFQILEFSVIRDCRRVA